MMLGLAQADADPSTLMIDATYLKAHRTASSLRLKKGGRAPDRPHERRPQHQAARSTDQNVKPLRFFLSAGQVSDYTGAAALLCPFPKRISCWQIGDMMPIGFDMRLKTKASRPASRGYSHEKSQSNMIGAAIAAAVVWK